MIVSPVTSRINPLKWGDGGLGWGSVWAWGKVGKGSRGTALGRGTTIKTPATLLNFNSLRRNNNLNE